MGSMQGMWGRKEAMDTTQAPGFGNWEMGTLGDTSLGWGGCGWRKGKSCILTGKV